MTMISQLPTVALNTPALPNWEQWAASKIPADQFEQRREPHLRYITYTAQFDEILERIQLICTRISTIADKTKLGGMMNSTRRLWDILDWLSLQYSAGASLELFTDIWPCVMGWAEEYAYCHAAYHDSPEAGNYMTPHAALRTEDYWTVALRLTCFGLLTGNAAQMPRVMQFLDYGNEDMEVRDGLLERLVAPFVAGRGTRHPPIALPQTAQGIRCRPRQDMEQGIQAVQPQPGTITPQQTATHPKHRLSPLVRVWHWLCFSPLLDRYTRRGSENAGWSDEVQNLCGPAPDLRGLDTRPIKSRTDAYYRPAYDHPVSFGYRLVNRHGHPLPQSPQSLSIRK